MSEMSPNEYRNPDGSYNVGALLVSIAKAQEHLDEFRAEHPTISISDNAAHESSAEPDLPHAS